MCRVFASFFTHITSWIPLNNPMKWFCFQYASEDVRPKRLNSWPKVTQVVKGKQLGVQVCLQTQCSENQWS